MPAIDQLTLYRELKERRAELIIQARKDGHAWAEIAQAAGLSRAMTFRDAQKHEPQNNRD